ncbi:hypothetical protein AAVH_24390 [Aphelenchoides avenae]|nr:hypothetical protein AAVH_24390 [Aphelenchus avenae]
MCELDWAELYNCNNGGGLQVRECCFDVYTGIEGTDTRDSSIKAERTAQTKKSHRNVIDRTKKVEEETHWWIGGWLELLFEGNVPTPWGDARGKARGKIEGRHDERTKKIREDQLKNEFHHLLESSTTLSDEVKVNAKKTTFKRVRMVFKLRTPPGWYQSVMTLKMSCGWTDLYPGFVDVVSRRAMSSAELHDYYVSGAMPERNLSEVQLLLEKEMAVRDLVRMSGDLVQGCEYTNTMQGLAMGGKRRNGLAGML